jgi:hypothetical protein
MKTIRPFFIIFALLLLAATGFMGTCVDIHGIEVDGDVVQEERDVSDFLGLEVSGAFDVFLFQGKSESLRIEADKNLMEVIKTEVKGDKLMIYTDKNIKRYTKMNVYLTFENLEMIDLSGAVEMSSDEMLHFDDLLLEGSGASELNLNMDVVSLNADFSGAAEINLEGQAKSAVFDVSGASEIDAFDFEVKHCELDVSGAAEAKLYVSDYLKVDVSGAASVRYKGSPELTTDISGAGSLKKY